jgi:hypothetical protein
MGEEREKEENAEDEQKKQGEGTDDFPLSLKQIIKLQSFLRRFKARKQCLLLLETRYEKIYDPKRKRHFYYDIIRDISSWKKPKLLKENDLQKISSLYTTDEALLMIQRQFRRVYALRRVRMLFQKRIKIKTDRRKKTTTFYNRATKVTFSKLPNFMKGKLNYDYEVMTEREEVSTKSKKKKKKNESETDESEEEDEIDDGGEEENHSDNEGASSASDSSSVIQAKRRAARVHPRSPSLDSISLSLDLMTLV